MPADSTPAPPGTATDSVSAQQDLREGVELGRLQSGQQFLLRQIARRFGTLDEATRRRLASATATELQTRAGNIRLSDFHD